MRAFVIGICLGFLLSAGIVLLMVGPDATLTGNVATSGTTMTLPTTGSTEQVDSDVMIGDGDIMPKQVVIDAGKYARISVFARTGPAKLFVPDALASIPLLSERQLHTFSVRFDEPGVYEAICAPCGSERSSVTASIVVV